MIQVQHSPKFARSWEIARQLQRGGSPVFIHFLRGVQGGFHMRPVEDLTETDLQAREELASLLEQGIQLLRHGRKAALRDGYLAPAFDSEKKSAFIHGPRLYPYRGNKTPPALVLEDLVGTDFDLASSRGQVVLVNFWASWCRPCVEEIPSLSRLVERMKGRPFKVVAVNIGESADDIKRFLQSIPVNFDILLDPNGHAVRDWKVYAYPSNFLIDRNGQIQFAYRGALEWDAPSIVATIEELL
jgi:thiol-disulfide isomerase/thioredoxin